MNNTQNKRLLLVDALRGFALMGIMLIHSVEHFDFFYLPDKPVLFSPETNKIVFDIIKQLISGKAYSFFAILFGFSFYIQMYRQEIKGVNFKPRFMWRLTVLLLLGLLHSLLYRGDILHIYALLGFFIIPFYKSKPKTLLIIAFLLALQIPLIIQLSYAFAHPDYEYVKTFGTGTSKIVKEAYAHGDFFDVIKVNAWEGHLSNWAWTFYNGRYIQLIALFLLGLFLGRTKYFENIKKHRKQSLHIFTICFIFSVILYFIRMYLPEFNLTAAQKKLLGIILKSYYNLTCTGGIFILVILLYKYEWTNKPMQLLAYVGRMSLTNYMVQAIIGVCLFYEFGFGLYHYLGAAISLIYGITFFIIQIIFSKYWLNRFYYGPFEWVWRAITFFDFNLKFKKKKEIQ